MEPYPSPPNWRRVKTTAGHNHAAETGHAGHNHGPGASTKRLAIALGLTTVFLVAELVGTFMFDSLALLSDATHMFTDSAALAIALAAIKIGQRPPDDQRTFGYRRFEILAAAFNAILLFMVAGYVLFEGIMRFCDALQHCIKGWVVLTARALRLGLSQRPRIILPMASVRASRCST